MGTYYRLSASHGSLDIQYVKSKHIETQGSVCSLKHEDPESCALTSCILSYQGALLQVLCTTIDGEVGRDISFGPYRLCCSV